LRNVENPPEDAKAGIAARMASAIEEHPVKAVRRWNYRDLTRAVAIVSGVKQDDDNGRTWLAGAQPRVPAVAAALAKVLAVRAGWLYFGEEPREDRDAVLGSPGAEQLATLSAEDFETIRAAKRGKKAG
jgi:hypothetical protein